MSVMTCIKDFLLGIYTGTFMLSVQTVRLQVEYVLLLFSVVHCTIQNLLTLLGKEGELDLFIQYELISCGYNIQ